MIDQRDKPETLRRFTMRTPVVVCLLARLTFASSARAPKLICLILLLISLVTANSTRIAADVSFMGLGTLGGDEPASRAHGISADGSVVIGLSAG